MVRRGREKHRGAFGRRRLGYLYIDSGAMYRAVALWAVQNVMQLDDLHRRNSSPGKRGSSF